MAPFWPADFIIIVYGNSAPHIQLTSMTNSGDQLIASGQIVKASHHHKLCKGKSSHFFCPDSQ
eukprot:scaffold3521_cov29-Prasinocladus_malaysianus.AAC.1